jgi:serine/threonine-protein kinase BUR1
VFGEMFTRKPILPGTSDIDQLDKIWQLCGSPNQHNWPNYDELPGCEGQKKWPTYPRKVKKIYAERLAIFANSHEQILYSMKCL